MFAIIVFVLYTIGSASLRILELARKAKQGTLLELSKHTVSFLSKDNSTSCDVCYYNYNYQLNYAAAHRIMEEGHHETLTYMLTLARFIEAVLETCCTPYMCFGGGIAMFGSIGLANFLRRSAKLNKDKLFQAQVIGVIEDSQGFKGIFSQLREQTRVMDKAASAIERFTTLLRTKRSVLAPVPDQQPREVNNSPRSYGSAPTQRLIRSFEFGRSNSRQLRVIQDPQPRAPVKRNCFYKILDSIISCLLKFRKVFAEENEVDNSDNRRPYIRNAAKSINKSIYQFQKDFSPRAVQSEQAFTPRSSLVVPRVSEQASQRSSVGLEQRLQTNQVNQPSQLSQPLQIQAATQLVRFSGIPSSDLTPPNQPMRHSLTPCNLPQRQLRPQDQMVSLMNGNFPPSNQTGSIDENHDTMYLDHLNSLI